MSTADVRVYRAPFDSPEADIVLQSAEGTLYRIPSFILKSTSGFWNSLLSLPSSSSSSSPIPASQPDAILEPMLRLMSGLPIPPWTVSVSSNDHYDERAHQLKTISQISSLLTLAESWDAPGPLSILRLSITSPPFLAHPLRLYALATHFNWIPEAKLASKHSLSLNLFAYDESESDSSTTDEDDPATSNPNFNPNPNPNHNPHPNDPSPRSNDTSALQCISSKSLLSLLRLHRSRRDLLKTHLDDPHIFSQGNSESSRCTACTSQIDNSAWRELKARIFHEMDKCPKGDFIGSWEMEEWKEAARCWESRCGKCGEVLYSKGATIAKMKDGLAVLPETI